MISFDTATIDELKQELYEVKQSILKLEQYKYSILLLCATKNAKYKIGQRFVRKMGGSEGEIVALKPSKFACEEPKYKISPIKKDGTISLRVFDFYANEWTIKV